MVNILIYFCLIQSITGKDVKDEGVKILTD